MYGVNDQSKKLKRQREAYDETEKNKKLKRQRDKERHMMQL